MVTPSELVTQPFFLLWTLFSILLGAILREAGIDLYNHFKGVLLSKYRGLDDDDVLRSETVELIDDLEDLHSNVRYTYLEDYYPEDYDPPESEHVKKAILASRRSEKAQEEFSANYHDRLIAVAEAYEDRRIETDIMRHATPVDQVRLPSIRLLVSELEEALAELKNQ